MSTTAFVFVATAIHIAAGHAADHSIAVDARGGRDGRRSVEGGSEEGRLRVLDVVKAARALTQAVPEFVRDLEGEVKAIRGADNKSEAATSKHAFSSLANLLVKDGKGQSKKQFRATLDGKIPGSLTYVEAQVHRFGEDSTTETTTTDASEGQDSTTETTTTDASEDHDSTTQPTTTAESTSTGSGSTSRSSTTITTTSVAISLPESCHWEQLCAELECGPLSDAIIKYAADTSEDGLGCPIHWLHHVHCRECGEQGGVLQTCEHNSCVIDEEEDDNGTEQTLEAALTKIDELRSDFTKQKIKSERDNKLIKSHHKFVLKIAGVFIPLIRDLESRVLELQESSGTQGTTAAPFNYLDALVATTTTASTSATTGASSTTTTTEEESSLAHKHEEVFEKYDKNRDGSLDKSEAAEMLKALTATEVQHPDMKPSQGHKSQVPGHEPQVPEPQDLKVKSKGTNLKSKGTVILAKTQHRPRNSLFRAEPEADGQESYYYSSSPLTTGSTTA